jgi:hypothetical protein
MVALLHSPLGIRHPAPKIHHMTGGGGGLGRGGKTSKVNKGGESEEDSDGDGNVYKGREKGDVDVGKKDNDEKELDDEEGNYDLIPHQIRGSLSTFTQISPMVRDTLPIEQNQTLLFALTLHCTALPLGIPIPLPLALPLALALALHVQCDLVLLTSYTLSLSLLMLYISAVGLPLHTVGL